MPSSNGLSFIVIICRNSSAWRVSVSRLRRAQLLQAFLPIRLHIGPLAGESAGEDIVVQDAREALADGRSVGGEQGAQLPVLASVGMERELTEHAQFGEALEDFGWLPGEVHFV